MAKGDGSKEHTFPVALRHAAGSGCAQYFSLQQDIYIMTYGADGKVQLLDDKLQPKGSLQVDQKAPHTFTINAAASQAAVVVNERYVKVVQLPAMTMDDMTSLSLPVRALASSPDGKHMVLGGDDAGVRMCRFTDGMAVRKLTCDDVSKSYYYYGLAWDPAGQFLAGAQMDGTLCVWDLKEIHNASSKKRVQKYRILRKVDRTTHTHPCGLSWYPDGGAVLAVPGADNDVVLLERDYLTGGDRERRGDYLAGGHNAQVVCCAFSPNGIYVASGDEAGVVCIWDATRHTIVSKGKAAAAGPPTSNATADGADGAPREAAAGSSATGSQRAIISLSWHPTANSLLVMNAAGEVCSWSGCVPSPLPGPAVPLDELDKVESEAPNQPMDERGVGTDRLPDDEDDEGDNDNESLNDFIVEDKRGRGQGGGVAALTARPGAPQYVPPRPAPPPELPMQRPFQPCSTPGDGQAPHFLAYTKLGCLISRPVEDRHSVEVTLHDTQRLLAMGGRVPPITDYFRYTHGCLGERGVLLGSPPQRDMASMIMYRPFVSQPFDRAEWQAGLPEGEAVVCLAAGSSFAAVATSAGLLRLFSPAGLQLAIIQLPGPAVAMAAQNHSLAVVTVAGNPSLTQRTQNLWLTVYEADTTSCSLSCACALTPGPAPSGKHKQTAAAPGSITSLTWLGFNDRGAVAIGDSTGAILLRSPMWGGCWVPIHRESEHVKAGERYWPVAIQVSPAPFLTGLPVRLPTLNQRDGDLDSQRIMTQHMLAQAQASCQLLGGGHMLASALAAAERGADKASLIVFQAALKANKPALAHDAATCLVQTASMEGALKLANLHKIPVLAERISMMIETRRQEEELAMLGAQEEINPGLANATMTPIPMKNSVPGASLQPLQDTTAHNQGPGGATGQEPGSAGPPSTGGGLLTALKAAAQSSPAIPPAAPAAGQENGQKRKAVAAAPLNNPFARRPAKQSKA